ncbi:50S ribosomal protein L24 [Acanthopleuribacter pedis]|uniref:Large ribosomal subunit protein uL24 n=1 Tax=Acanthopleuribacter pedis TaxID=442870 RepID=A0A8J7QQG4_9BACT|nr:50S ribosomal protein L24 [Acanthopleuribacter pedis]MBO1322285.1 50S ribosomal protein L24 [Acanthopleuribacter pedis]
MAAKIKKGDTVAIIAGKDIGQKGKVLKVDHAKGRVVVEGWNMVKKHRRASQVQEGGIIDIEAPIHISNVALVDPSDDKPCRVGFEIRNDKKVRVSKRTNTVID